MQYILSFGALTYGITSTMKLFGILDSYTNKIEEYVNVGNLFWLLMFSEIWGRTKTDVKICVGMTIACLAISTAFSSFYRQTPTLPLSE